MSGSLRGETKKLGFGLMRLPRRGVGIDIRETSQMVDRFLEAGCTYFDTAHIYLGSETAARKALVERYPREQFTLATKLYVPLALTEGRAKQQFYTSLKRTKAEYFDYYLVHCVMENNYQKYEKFGIWDFVEEQKKRGLIKHVGFSFHDGPALLERILTDHPEVDFVQLQINYADWENPFIESRANYEVARRHGKEIVVMEPVKGGRLAQPPREVQKLMRNYRPDRSYASWAIRFAASLDGILTVLSGMSSIAQMEDNLSYMKDFQPLNQEEQRIIREAQRILGASAAIPCTGCHYCTKGCPRHIPIPEIFEARNLQLSNGQASQAREAYRAATENTGKASDCVQCKRCEEACPQHLPITQYLKQCAEAFV